MADKKNKFGQFTMDYFDFNDIKDGNVDNSEVYIEAINQIIAICKKTFLTQNGIITHELKYENAKFVCCSLGTI